MQSNLDYIFFVYGLSFFTLAAISFRFVQEKVKTPLRWKWMALFGVLHGTNEWLDLVAISFPFDLWGKIVALAVLAVSFFCLFEFGRQSLRDQAGKPWVGIWIYGPLFLLCVICGSYGLTGWNVGIRYTLGLTGGVLAALAFFQRSLTTPFHHKKRLRFAAFFFMLYALASGLVVPRQDFFPAAFINQDSFFQLTGLIVQVVRAACAFLISSLCFSIFISLETLWSEERTRRRIKRIFVTQWMVLFFIVVAGWFFLQRMSEQEVARKQQYCLDRTRYLAQAVNVEHIRKLTGSKADLALSQFERVWNYLQSVPKVFPEYRFAYFLVLQDQKLVFLADSEPLGSADRSLPGDIYNDAPQDFYDVFQGGQHAFIGPYVDQRGTWVSSAIPVFDPSSGKILAIFCLDQNAKDWAQGLSRDRLAAILSILFLSFFIVLSFYIFGRETSLTKKVVYVETFYASGFCLAVTVFIFLSTLQASRQQLSLEFQSSAIVSQEIFGNTFHEARYYLDSLTQFFDCSSNVTREEFHRYVSRLVRDHVGLQAFAWIPRVTFEEKTLYEAHAGEEGVSDFMIFEKSPSGEKISVLPRKEYFPLYYLEPLSDQKAALGFDSFSEPIRRQALQRSRDLGLRVATGMIDFVVNQKERKRGILIYQPVYEKAVIADGLSDARALKGFLMMAIRPQALLETGLLAGLLAGRQFTQAYVLDLSDPLGFSIVASYPLKEGLALENPGSLLQKKPGEFKEIMLFSFFGHSYAVVVTPEKIFFDKHPKFLPWFVLCGGLLLSGLLTLLTYVLQNQRKRAEDIVVQRTAELFESEQRFRSIFDNMADGVAIYRVVDNGDNFVFVDLNRAGQKSSKVNRSDVVGRRITDVFPSVRDIGLLDVMKRVWRTGTSQQHPQSFYKDDQLEQWVENFVCKLSSDLIAAIYTDVTDLKRQEQQVLDAHQRLQSIMDSATRVSIISTDLKGVIQTFNKGAQEILGYQEGEIIGKEVFSVLHLESEILPYSQELSKELGYYVTGFETFVARVKKGQREEREWTYVRKDGTFLTVNLVVTAIKNSAGIITGFLGIASDVTESKKAREELAEVNRSLKENEKMLRRLLGDLEKSNEELKKTQGQLVQSEKMVAVGQLSAGLAHEIKNPLAIMLLAVESLEKKTDIFSEEIQKKFLMIRDSVHRMNKIIKGLLSFSHISESSFKPVLANYVISAAVALVQNTAKINNVELRIRLCPDQWILADALMLEQVFVNIINNAMDAVKPSGVIFISTWTEEDTVGKPQRLYIEFRDTGPGIPPDVVKNIFNPFFTTKEAGKGTGLGLSLAFSTIEKHKGKITASNHSSGKGAVFLIELPILADQATL